MTIRQIEFLKPYILVQKGQAFSPSIESPQKGYVARAYFIFWGIESNKASIQAWNNPLVSEDKEKVKINDAFIEKTWRLFCEEMKTKNFTAVAPVTTIPDDYKNYLEYYYVEEVKLC